MNKAKDVIAKQSGKKSLHANFYVITCKYIVASGDLSKNFTRKLIFLVANATVLVAVWSPVLTIYLFIYLSNECIREERECSCALNAEEEQAEFVFCLLLTKAAFI